jgi:hypothetical protein
MVETIVLVSGKPCIKLSGVRQFIGSIAYPRLQGKTSSVIHAPLLILFGSSKSCTNLSSVRKFTVN